jgi:hypothetical protein
LALSAKVAPTLSATEPASPRSLNVYVGIQTKPLRFSDILPKKTWLRRRIGDSMTKKFSSETIANRCEKDCKSR